MSLLVIRRDGVVLALRMWLHVALQDVMIRTDLARQHLMQHELTLWWAARSANAVIGHHRNHYSQDDLLEHHLHLIV